MKTSHSIDVLVIFLGLSITVAIAPISAQSNAPIPTAPESKPAPQQPQQPVAQQRSYFGIGAAFGLSGSSTALSTGGLAVFGKQVLSDNLSIHSTGVYFGSGIAFDSVSLALDFPQRDDSGNIVFSSFLGGGAMLRTENDSTVLSPLVVAGVNLPLSQDITGLIHLNMGFPTDRQAEIGAIIGAGYNF
jgi:hypothetical protein